MATQSQFTNATGAAKLLKCHVALVARWCRQERMPGAVKLGSTWLIPLAGLARPVDAVRRKKPA
jgi:hypothetical protein